MGYFVDSYERNKKYLVAFAVLAFCIAVIYTKRLVDFPKIGVALFVVLAFFIFLLPKKNVGTFLAMLIGGLSFAFITPVLNTPDEQVHLSRTIHIVEGNVNMGNKTSILPKITLMFIRISKNHLPNLLYLKKGRRPNK